MTKAEIYALLREARKNLKDEQTLNEDTGKWEWSNKDLRKRIDAALKASKAPAEVEWSRRLDGSLQGVWNNGDLGYVSVWKSTITEGYRWEIEKIIAAYPEPRGGTCATVEEAIEAATKATKEFA